MLLEDEISVMELKELVDILSLNDSAIELFVNSPVPKLLATELECDFNVLGVDDAKLFLQSV